MAGFAGAPTRKELSEGHRRVSSPSLAERFDDERDAGGVAVRRGEESAAARVGVSPGLGGRPGSCARPERPLRRRSRRRTTPARAPSRHRQRCATSVRIEDRSIRPRADEVAEQLMTVIERRAHENLTLGAALPAEARSATCDGRTAAFHATRARRRLSPAPAARCSFRARKRASPSSGAIRSPQTAASTEPGSTSARRRGAAASSRDALLGDSGQRR